MTTFLLGEWVSRFKKDGTDSLVKIMGQDENGNILASTDGKNIDTIITEENNIEFCHDPEECPHWDEYWENKIKREMKYL